MFNKKILSISLFTLLSCAQTALAARTIVACVAGNLAGSFAVGSGTECEVSTTCSVRDDTCAGQGNLYSSYQPSTQGCVCNNVGYPTSVYTVGNRVNFVCDPSRPNLVTVTRLVGTFTYLGCAGGGGTVVAPSRSAIGSFESIFSTCSGYKYVAITRLSSVQNSAVCFTDYAGYTPVSSCGAGNFQIFTHTPGATISGYSRKRRQIEEEEQEVEENEEFVEVDTLDTQWETEQVEQIPGMSPEEIQAQFMLVSSQASCPMGLTACAVPSLDGSDEGFECIEIETELESCGGCLHGLYHGQNVQSTANGTDCSALPNVALSGVTCQAGQCHVSACDDGFTLSDGQCVEAELIL